MDGSDYSVIIDSGVYWPTGVALDRENHRIYWVDAWLDKLESSTYSGLDRRLLMDSQSLQHFHPYGITFFNGSVFWSNTNLSSVHQARVKNDTLVSHFVIHDKIYSPTQLQIVSDTLPRLGG